jgi:mono/diheme cytochrome c family protein
MFTIPTKYLIFSGIIFSGLFLNACQKDRNIRGYDYAPEMAHSIAYETYSPNPVFADRKTAQYPVKNTIPRHMIPFQYPNTPEGYELAGKELKNPVEATEENLVRGKKAYDIFCANCHGTDGRGDGNLFTSGKYPSEPPSLVTKDMIQKPDGSLYHTITVGSAIMGPFGSMIRPEDRWKIILYMKELATVNKTRDTK